MILDCDWSIFVQLIPNRSAKFCNKNLRINKSCVIQTCTDRLVYQCSCNLNNLIKVTGSLFLHDQRMFALLSQSFLYILLSIDSLASREIWGKNMHSCIFF